ncbi:MAG: D-tyrosyl-tRNA(Tyr) deacylase [Cyclobacteriaceae bacterium]|nr:D-tyrosyl-tRNA(Tyr) deacylase [Cyclobacteriaceae bacterium]
MIAVIQRVSESSVLISGEKKSAIGRGLTILLGIEEEDGMEDIQWLARKILNLRIFDDPQGVMNESVMDQQGELLVISQFTLHASTRKGNRPSYIRAARPEVAIPLYEKFIGELEEISGRKIQSGEFGADMKVSLVNDGPVTIIIDTKEKK